MRNSTYALDINLLYVDVSVVFELLVSVAKGGLSKATNSFFLRTGVLRTHLSYLYLYCFCAAVNRLSTASLIRNNLVSRLLRSMRGDTFPGRFDDIADGKSIVDAPGG